MAEAQIGSLPKKLEPELIYDKNYRHSLTASSYTALRSLLSNVTGTPYLTEYYRQVLGASEEPHSIQPDSIETYQSYTRIKGMIIKIDGDRTPNFDDDTGTITEQGIAFVISDLAPVIYDVFVADIGDGRTGLFHIPTPPRIRELTVDKVYEVDFKLLTVMNQSLEDNLNKKVIEDLVYSKDSAIRGGNAVISATDFYDNKRLYELLTLIAQSFIQDFYYHPEKTVVLPVADELVYDPYLTRFLQYTIPTRRLGMQDSINVIGVDTGRNSRGGTKINVWDMFKQNNFNNPQQYKQKYYQHERDALLNTRFYGGFYYSKLELAILTEEYGSGREAYQYGGPVLGMGGVPLDVEKAGIAGVEHNYYFSDEFYTGKPTKPNEKFIFDFFRDKTIDKKALIKILDQYWVMPDMDRFYMAGIYITAINISLSTTYNYL